MEEMTWEQRHHALTHILTQPPTTTPSLHSQFFISTQLPSSNSNYLLHFHSNSYYPPIHHHQFRWAFGLFLRRMSRLEGSWRATCPYQLPQPLVLAKGVQPPKWGHQDKIEYVKMRLRRKRLGNHFNPWIPILLPNLILFSFLLWDPFLSPHDP
ncbi:hypothetical protein L6452_19862 [Arctium lappa]|uniref:Uncharacterized protein n=1 Tax=Arctium lappa TaxID=4217 RepID=A0ACB9BAA2_ARCLA|nr:hypothetical protein L6452_19862 [Arctium lappa]